MYSAVKHFAYFIEGRRVHIYTDHKPLTALLVVQSVGRQDSNGTSVQFRCAAHPSREQWYRPFHT